MGNSKSKAAEAAPAPAPVPDVQKIAENVAEKPLESPPQAAKVKKTEEEIAAEEAAEKLAYEEYLNPHQVLTTMPPVHPQHKPEQVVEAPEPIAVTPPTPEPEKEKEEDKEDPALLARIQAAADRLEAIEGVMRVRKHLSTSSVSTTRLCRVPKDYYDRPMIERAVCLSLESNPCSIDQLCKSIVFENVNFDPSEAGATTTSSSESESGSLSYDPSYSRYYLLLVQYNAKFSSEKLERFLQKLRPVDRRLPKSKYNLQLAVDGDKVTGFTHNSVCPFGLARDLPVIMASAITEVSPPYVFMGGGAVDVKLGLMLSEFTRVFKPLVADVSEPRLNE